MDRSSPEACFLTAQQAMVRHDWDTFFACLSINDLRRLAAIGVTCVHGEGGEGFAELCRGHGIPDDAVERVRAAGIDISASAAVISFVAEIERLRRDVSGGGSVSSAMFVDEVLVDVVVKGSRAIGVRRRQMGARRRQIGVRRRQTGADERLPFVRRHGHWHIVLFGRA